MLLSLLLAADAPVKTAVPIPSSPELGKAEGKCRPNEAGPSFLVSVNGLKDRKGHIKVEVYPATDADFLQDDNILVYQGKTFRRVEEEVPQTGPVQVCIRVPAAGAYGLTVLHDRDNNRKISLSQDGFGVANAQHFRWSMPKLPAARVVAGAGPTRINITLAYRSSLISFDPIKP
ncbi:DUF2141 domain-containing protein [Novosphingobium umbonatum]|uniref:DUF2141 domain-containing protein n=1 Tax=Novosphingobium umbonatum TaxID=1908524 RepID=A0A3S2X4D0_9SPHN|nr:DUF2141 domain-containing protein [Novosphingobium umbonatum]RVU05445.1 DUF2141 domain-containing protein [Novosphingobium umbonatum]